MISTNLLVYQAGLVLLLLQFVISSLSRMKMYMLMSPQKKKKSVTQHMDRSLFSPFLGDFSLQFVRVLLKSRPQARSRDVMHQSLPRLISTHIK